MLTDPVFYTAVTIFALVMFYFWWVQQKEEKKELLERIKKLEEQGK